MTTKRSAPVALVTGASSGVGLAAALRLAQAGYRTVATMRDLGKASALQERARAAGLSIDLREIDVARGDAARAATRKIMDDLGVLDVLVNNAGAGFLGSVEQTSEEDLRRVMEVNFFGVWTMTQAVLPRMRERGAGRIISVTSVGGLIGQPFNEAYCAAKFAVEGMMEGLAPLARRMGLWVSLVEPGPINTEFVANVRATSASTLAKLTPPYDRLLQAYMRSSGDVFATHGQSADDVAGVILEVAQSSAPHFRNVTSDFARAVVKPKVVDMTGDSVVEAFAERLG